MRTPPFGIIWDMDGTLVDTAELHFQAWQRLADERGQPFSRADFAATFGRRNPEIIRQLFNPNADDAEVAEVGDRKETYYRESARNGVELLPGVRPLLDGFAALGIPQGIGSSAPRGNLELILELTQTTPLFKTIVSMEDVQRGKPDPQVFQVAADRLGLPPPRCIVFEDAVAGVEAAKAGGMQCVAVRFVAHHPVEKLAAAGADRIVDCLTEVKVLEVSAMFD